MAEVHVAGIAGIGDHAFHLKQVASTIELLAESLKGSETDLGEIQADTAFLAATAIREHAAGISRECEALRLERLGGRAGA